MVLRLVNDAVWRMRFLYLGTCFVMIAVWLVSTSGYAPPSTSVMASLMLAYMLGPMFANLNAGMRELRVLPVTRRQHWQTTWILSVLVGPIASLTSGLLAATILGLFAGSARIPPETLLLSGVYSMSYAGALLPIGPMMSRLGAGSSGGRAGWLWNLALALGVAGFIGGLVLPWFVAERLPVTTGDLTAPAVLGLAVCIFAAGATWFWTPAPAARPSQEAYRAAAAGPGVTLPVVNRFSGIASLAFPHGVLTVTIALLAIAAAAAYPSIVDSGEAISAFLRRNALLPFDRTPVARMDSWAIMFAFIATSTGPWNAFARQLKVLPLATREINALLLLTPLVTWLLIWLVLIAAHAVALGSLPGDVRPDLLAFAWGVTALVQSLALRFKRPGFFFPWYVMPMGLAGNLIQSGISSPDSVRLLTVFVATGAAALGLAAFINHRTLARSTSNANVYKPQTIGLPFTGAGVPR